MAAAGVDAGEKIVVGLTRVRRRAAAAAAQDGRPPVRFEAAMQCVRSANQAFVHGVNLAEVELAVHEDLQLLTAWVT